MCRGRWWGPRYTHVGRHVAHVLLMCIVPAISEKLVAVTEDTEDGVSNLAEVYGQL